MNIKQRSLKALTPLRPVVCLVCGARPLAGWRSGGEYQIKCPKGHHDTIALGIVIFDLTVPHTVIACGREKAVKIWNAGHERKENILEAP